MPSALRYQTKRRSWAAPSGLIQELVTTPVFKKEPKGILLPPGADAVEKPAMVKNVVNNSRIYGLSSTIRIVIIGFFPFLVVR
jgi:hypothetical protein